MNLMKPLTSYRASRELPATANCRYASCLTVSYIHTLDISLNRTIHIWLILLSKPIQLKCGRSLKGFDRKCVFLIIENVM